MIHTHAMLIWQKCLLFSHSKFCRLLHSKVLGDPSGLARLWWRTRMPGLRDDEAASCVLFPAHWRTVLCRTVVADNLSTSSRLSCSASAIFRVYLSSSDAHFLHTNSDRSSRTIGTPDSADRRSGSWSRCPALVNRALRLLSSADLPQTRQHCFTYDAITSFSTMLVGTFGLMRM